MKLRLSIIIILAPVSPALTMEQYKTPWFQSKACITYLKIRRTPNNCYEFLQRQFYDLVKRNLIDLTSKDEYDFSLAHVAALSDRPDILMLLYGNGISCDSVNTSGETPLHLAVKYGSIKTIETLLECNADITKKALITDKSVLHFAAERENKEVLSYLLKKAKLNNSNIECRDVLGNTPLHAASSCGISSNINILLTYQANPCALNNICQTPLCLAVLKNNTNAIFILACAVAEKAYVTNAEEKTKNSTL